MPIAGVALFTIAVVGAQTLTAVGVDKLGIGPAGRSRLGRASGRGLLAIVGVVVAVGGRVSGTTAAVVVPAVLAASSAPPPRSSRASTARVTVAARSPMTTTLAELRDRNGDLARPRGAWPAVRVVRAAGAFAAPWWAWLGGLVGTVSSASRPWPYGPWACCLMLLMLAGQLVAAVGLDALDPQTRGHITLSVVVGLIVTLGAAALAGVAGARSARRARTARGPMLPWQDRRS